MTRSSTSRPRLLSTLHVLVIVAIGICWATCFWQHTPARVLFARAVGAEYTPAKPVFEHPMYRLDEIAARRTVTLTDAIMAGIGDVSFGLLMLGLLGIGTGVYVRRLETWLAARKSGQAVSFGGAGLAPAVLAANQARKGGTS